MQALKWLLPVVLCLPIALPLMPSQSAHATEAQTKAVLAHAFYKKEVYPQRGAAMQQVRKRHGKPLSVTVSKGKSTKKWPKITVWHYQGYAVYFERGRVLHSVVH